MSKEISPVVYTNISTDTTILATAGVFHGIAILPASTGICTAYVYDASATATGTAIYGIRVASTAGITPNQVMLTNGIMCRKGIHIDVTCTTAVDQVIVYYSPG
jgi:hypothetical protein